MEINGIKTKELKIEDLGLEDEIFSECLLITSRKNPNVQLNVYVSKVDGEVSITVIPGDTTKINVEKCNQGMSYLPTIEFTEATEEDSDITIT